MSQVFTPSSGGLSSVSTDATLSGDGTSGDPLSVAAPYLETVSTDATLTGDGTVASPLSVVPTPPTSTYSVAKALLIATQAYTLGPAPTTVWPDTSFDYVQTIASADADFAAGVITFNTAGTYRITIQATFGHTPTAGNEDCIFRLGLSDAFPNPVLYEVETFSTWAPNQRGSETLRLLTIQEMTVGQTLAPTFTLDGTSGANIAWSSAEEGSFITVERVA